jgi:hypothetical protein
LVVVGGKGSQVLHGALVLFVCVFVCLFCSLFLAGTTA